MLRALELGLWHGNGRPDGVGTGPGRAGGMRAAGTRRSRGVLWQRLLPIALALWGCSNPPIRWVSGATVLGGTADTEYTVALQGVAPRMTAVAQAIPIPCGRSACARCRGVPQLRPLGARGRTRGGGRMVGGTYGQQRGPATRTFCATTARIGTVRALQPHSIGGRGAAIGRHRQSHSIRCTATHTSRIGSSPRRGRRLLRTPGGSASYGRERLVRATPYQ